MQHLVHTVLLNSKTKGLLKFEIYSGYAELNHLQGFPYENSRVIAYSLKDNLQEIINSNVDLSGLYERKKLPTGYVHPEGGFGVKLGDVIEYLRNLY